MTRYICITGGKGGVGKTTTAVNLATSMHKGGVNVILVDSNISTPNVHHHIEIPEIERHLHHAINKEVHIIEAIHTHPSGLKFVPALTALGHLKYPDYHGLRDALHDLKGHADIIILDGAAGLGHEAVIPMEVADEVLIVTTPDKAAVEAARQTTEVVKEIKKPILGVILNQVRKDRMEHSIQQVEEEIGYPVLAVIPHDNKVRMAWKEKNPVVHSHPRSRASREFLKLTGTLLGESYAKSLEKENRIYHAVLRRLGLE